MAAKKKAKNPLYNGLVECPCVELIHKALAKSESAAMQNTRVVTTMFTGRVALMTEKVDSGRRGKPALLTASHCPFCGKKYPEAA